MCERTSKESCELEQGPGGGEQEGVSEGEPGPGSTEPRGPCAWSASPLFTAHSGPGQGPQLTDSRDPWQTEAHASHPDQANCHL